MSNQLRVVLLGGKPTGWVQRCAAPNLIYHMLKAKVEIVT